MKLLALGGCGGMGRFAVRTALADEIWSEIVIADLDGSRALRFARDCDDPRVRGESLDVTDGAALASALGACDVVLAAVGPYYRFGVPVLRAAIDAGCHYLDLNDDWEPTLAMLDLHDRARAAGVTAVVGMGASPGISNLLAVTAARELDRVETLHTCWGIGDQGGLGSLEDSTNEENGGSGGAATEHWVQQLTGTIRLVEDGRPVDAAPLRAVAIDYPGTGEVVCHTVGHPEPMTLVRTYPDLVCAYNLMDLPRAIIRLVRRVAERVDAGEWSVAEGARAIDARLERGGLRFLFSRVGLEFVVEMAGRPRHLPGVCAIAEGRLGDRRLRIGAGLQAEPPGGMGGITGIPAGICLGLLARDQVKRRGVFAPEQVIEPDSFFRALAPHCRRLPPDGSPVRVSRAEVSR